MKNTCPYIDNVDKLFEDEISEFEKEQIKKHIENCSQCLEEYKLIENIDQELHNIEEIDLPEGFNKKLHEKLIKESQNIEKKNGFFNIASWQLKIAAVFVLCVVISFQVFICIQFFYRIHSF